VGVGDSSGVGVRLGSTVALPLGVTVGDGVLVNVDVGLGVEVGSQSPDVEVTPGVGVKVGYGVRATREIEGPFPSRQASRVAKRAMTPTPVKNRRRLNSRPEDLAGEKEVLSVISCIIEAGKRNVKSAQQTPRRRFPYALHIHRLTARELL
jgi:hypothetical protein